MQAFGRTLWLCVWCLCFTAAQAELKFPQLTGHVVDSAQMLSASTESRITAMLDAHERATSDQLVVVTVPDLQGDTIESFGYQLGRTWGIGQKDKNNGALLIIAKSERKIRIEVGYGLEGELTDAISANIIHARISPSFKRGDFDGGIEAGVDAIIQALGGHYEMQKNDRIDDGKPVSFWIIFFMIVVMMVLSHLGRLFGFLPEVNPLSHRGGRGSFGGGGGGFRGGGGGFGGGGASGGW